MRPQSSLLARVKIAGRIHFQYAVHLVVEWMESFWQISIEPCSVTVLWADLLFGVRLLELQLIEHTYFELMTRCSKVWKISRLSELRIYILYQILLNLRSSLVLFAVWLDVVDFDTTLGYHFIHPSMSDYIELAVIFGSLHPVSQVCQCC